MSTWARLNSIAARPGGRTAVGLIVFVLALLAGVLGTSPSQSVRITCLFPFWLGFGLIVWLVLAGRSARADLEGVDR